MPKTNISDHSTELQVSQESKGQTKALYQVVSGIAHEIRSPLTQTAQLTKTLINKYKDREFEYISYREFQDIMDTLVQVNRQLNFCCETADQLISLKAAESKSNKKVSDINAVVEEALELIRHRFKVIGISIKYKGSKSLPSAVINSLDLEQIITNVADNAAQAMPTGGLLKIRTSLTSDGKMIQVNFQDDGIGICKEHMDRILDPFFTTKHHHNKKGSGLGLSIVYSILKANKGDILIESSLSKGTLVKILIPVAKQKRLKK